MLKSSGLEKVQRLLAELRLTAAKVTSPQSSVAQKENNRDIAGRERDQFGNPTLHFSGLLTCTTVSGHFSKP